MAIGREIRTKIKSVKNTQKITRAMEMVAASKMRRAQDRMQTSRPYAEQIRRVIGHISKSHSEYRHAFLEAREVKRVGIIVVSTDRGLCGGLNVNLFKPIVKAMQEWYSQEVEVELCVIGTKAEHFFKRNNAKISALAHHLGDAPVLKDIVGVVNVMFDAYQNKTLDRLYLAYNEFENTMVQKPLVQQILPFEPTTETGMDHYWDYIYEPDAKEILEFLFQRYIESQTYQAMVENIACEQAARMVAMKSATDNAAEMIDNLQLAYNKARQAAITQEISEIVSGAAAV